MWLLKFHISCSILLAITFIGFSKVCINQIKANGWLDETKKKKIIAWLVFFVPIMNVLMVAVLFLTILVKKEDFEALTNYIKEESEDKE